MPDFPRLLVLLVLLAAACSAVPSQRTDSDVRLVPIAEGWAKTSVNAVIFRKNSLTTHGDTQFVAFYDPSSRVVLAKRHWQDTTWTIRRTAYTGNTTDAHNSISIGVDGDGILHVAWDHHNDPLHYVRGTGPGGLEMTEPMEMTGYREDRVTYPEFYALPDGDLLFLYRDGSSGNGDLMMKRYDTDSRSWSLVQDGLLDGEGERNAYWQFAVDRFGTFHLSWVWRETGDVMTNHDLAYAKSSDGGATWNRSDGTAYALPITASTADYARRIPQNSSLINQTSMTTDDRGRPYIASYWTPAGDSIPQYHVVYRDGTTWRTRQVGRRTQPFSLGGFGTRRIPISRPKILVDAPHVYVVFRDEERRERVSVAISSDIRNGAWRIFDLTIGPVEAWEPTYDHELWRRKHVLHLFHQRVVQGSGEAEIAGEPPSMVSVLEWTPDR